MEVCKELKKLSKEFKSYGHKLYLVGGYVRDELLGLNNSDIDITSSLNLENLKDICTKLKIKFNNINPKLGTIQLTYNNIKFEYTRFRKESYNISGIHTPENIEFVDDIEVDMLRRDFTINSIYYDIENGNFIDNCNGIEHLNKHLIQTTNIPEITLQDDGLRILRALRFASTLNFRIENKTKIALKKFTPNLNKISKERILKELKLLVCADIKYSISNNYFLKYCNQLNLSKYLFNSSLDRIKKISNKQIRSFYKLSSSARLIGFYILILINYLRNYTSPIQLGYTINMLLGINGIKESNENIKTTEKLYRIIQNLNYNKDTLNASVNFLTLSDTEREIVKAYINKKANTLLSDNISKIKDNNLPLNIHELDILPEDLISAGIEKIFISKIIASLYNQVLNMSVPNIKEDLINIAKEINNTFKNINK